MLPFRRGFGLHRKPAVLPPPASAHNSRSNKRATFNDDELRGGFRVHWDRFKKRLGAGSALSESLVEVTESATGSESIIRRDQNGNPLAVERGEEDEEVDETVVDNNFWLDATSKSLTQPSEHGAATPEKSGSGTHGTHLTDGDSTHEHTPLFNAAFAIYYRTKIALKTFFFTTFYDPVSEAQYKRETYYQSKSLAVWGSLFIILNWVLVCILIDKESVILWDKIFYYGISPVLAVPLLPMIIYDWPKKFPIFYQMYMSFSLWSWGAFNLLELQLCGYYDPTSKVAVWNCPNKEFVGVFYYTSAFPVISLFALGQNRLSATISGFFTAFFIACVIPYRQSWIRNTLNFLIYMTFLVWIHYQKEHAERRLHTMRDRLKIQYRATQQAQVRESKAADSKKRFSSYIFHEVRVPLNTALLAVQNMEASGIFKKDDIEYTALEGSLTMMSKVLNDVLDFNRMDSGRFESLSKPYAFHKVMKSMLVPLQLTATARGLELITDLDPQIDVIARTCLYLARGETEDSIRKMMCSDDDESGLVVGDEHRLRQIVTNLTSNACKFTPTGGKIWVRTKLLLPSAEDYQMLTSLTRPSSPQPAADCPSEPGEDANRLSATQLKLHNALPAYRSVLERIVIRIEVEDTGVGIRRKDMVDNRLFSPYVQTDIGRFQGGKGTGLGLALSKHIIRLSGGRLGVKSKRNMGSTFWVELSMGVGQKVLQKQNLDGKDGLVARTFELNRATTEAFKAPESEGVTPSTVLDSVEGSPHDSAFNHPSRERSNTNDALRQIMEHSGQIELMPRNKHASFPQPPSPAALAPSGPLTSASEDMVKPLLEKSPSSDATLTAARPNKVTIPPPQLSFSASTATAASETAPPFTPPTLSPPPAAATSSSPLPPATSPLFDPPLNVLVVDDDALTRKLMSRMLTRIGCAVETADNGKNALDMIVSARNPFTFAPTRPGDKPRKVGTPYLQEEEPKYDIVFLDNQMPVMSGVEMVRKLRDLKRVDFVVGITGNALKEDQDEYLEAGVDAVLTKPVKEASLRSYLSSADERRRAQQRLTSNDDHIDSTSRPP